jgi:hypothetical protein
MFPLSERVLIRHKRKVAESTKKYLAAKQLWKCNTCQSLLDHTYQADHIIPLCHGGDNSDENLQILCPNCHCAKTFAEQTAARSVTHYAAPSGGVTSVDGRVSAEMFAALFEPWAGGAYPLAVAKHLCTLRYGMTFDERSVAVDVAHDMVFPPSFSKFFTDAGMSPQGGGPMLQAVRLRKGVFAKESTRSTA